ncbi:MAG TPA: DUF1549 domain-containing protein [Pirellulales bacterium]|nr:DUF1549 domain-containing protein [Pirellulales bacterium]
MWKRNLLFVLLCGCGLVTVAANMPRPGQRADRGRPMRGAAVGDDDFRHTLERVNAAFRKDWADKHLVPAAAANDLLVARRLALGLMGTIPSLEEVRALEASAPAARLDRWVDGLLSDTRYHDYFAERLARAYVGSDSGPFIFYRRRRLARWLSDQLRDGRPYDALVRELITSSGFATSQPATNFLAYTIDPDQQNFHVDERKLAARVSRAFLGVRIDCAECHDHPFERWKQSDFEGLAAFFAGTRQRFTGIGDDPGNRPLEVEDRTSGKLRKVAAQVPFDSDRLPEQGGARERLAAWVTDPHNEHFSRAITNRVWALIFGRGLVEPVDDLRAGQPVPPALAILADDFAAHGFDLRRLVRLITASEVFRLGSQANPAVPGHEITPEHEAAWAAFPLRRLRSEQVAGAIEQAASLETLDRETHLLLRLQVLIEQNQFTARFGDAGDNELTDVGATIPQRLMLMNGEMVHNRTRNNPLQNASSQIALLAANDREAVEVAYLAVLSRRPTPPEAAHFVEQLAGSHRKQRAAQLEDLCWTLINSVEFSWNH